MGVARRQGMPVIVSDADGKEPMVVLPLEIYEALLNESSLAPRPAPRASSEGVREPMRVPVRDVSSESTIAESEPEFLAELSMEERFYIEPLEEGKN